VVAAPMSDWRRVAAPIAATLALGYLAAMVVSGAQPVQRQFVEFEAKGVLKTPPERIRRIELVRADKSVSVIRRGDNGWATPAGAELDATESKRISLAVQMMHNSGPAREIPLGELNGADPAAFGLDAPRVTARFYESDADPVLTARFGERNPDEFLQYMRIDGDNHLYLMSRFIGEAWAAVLDGGRQR
jgi:hypothetical protein